MLHISKKKSENQPINIEIRNALSPCDSSDALAVEMDEMGVIIMTKNINLGCGGL